MKLTTKWQRIAVTPFSEPVSEPPVKKAHFGFCSIEARKVRGKVYIKKTNCNGRFFEYGLPQLADAKTLQFLQSAGLD